MSERSGVGEPSKKVIYGFVAMLAAYALARSLVAAMGKFLWYDELLTLTISGLGNWKAIMGALRLPLDGQPPLFHLIEHYAGSVSGKPEIALRLPSIMAIPCTLICVFVYVKRRAGEMVGALCAVAVLMTQVFQNYAAEARPYCLVVACIAFALVCYQRLASPVWTILLGISLALAQSLHYMAILAIVPFGLAEAVFFARTKKFRWALWAALVVGAVPLAIFWPLLAVNKTYYGAHFWAHFDFPQIPSTYGEIFLTNSQYGAAIMAVALCGVLGITVLLRRMGGGKEVASETSEEATLVFALAALPFIGYIIVVAVEHSALTSRYVLSTAVGVCVALGYILSRARWGALALVAVFIFSVVGMHELHFWRFVRSDIKEVHNVGAEAEKFISSAGHRELPVVIPNARNLAPLVHYGPASLRERLVYLTEIPQSSDSSDKSLKLLQLYMPLHIYRFAEFAAGHKEFLMYVEEKDPGRDPFTPYLFREGWTLETVALDDWRRVYLVRRNEHSSSEIASWQKSGSLNGN